jgi:hypothetical protein
VDSFCSVKRLVVISPIARCAPKSVVVVQLQPENIKFGLADHSSHIIKGVAWDNIGALRGTSDDIFFAWVRLEKFPKLLDTGNVSNLIICLD